MTSYFPITICRHSEHYWGMWCLAFPFARVADADAPEPRTWYHADELPMCRKVVVGIAGIKPETAFLWMMTDVRPTPEMVREALVVTPPAGGGVGKGGG